MKNASSSSESNRGKNPARRFSARRTTVAGMTATSLAIAGLTVPELTGIDFVETNVAEAQQKQQVRFASEVSSRTWTGRVQPSNGGQVSFNEVEFYEHDGDSRRFKKYPSQPVALTGYVRVGKNVVEDGVLATVESIDDLDYRGRIKIKDVAGNATSVSIPVGGELVLTAANGVGHDWPRSGGVTSFGITEAYAFSAPVVEAAKPVIEGSVNMLDGTSPNGVTVKLFREDERWNWLSLRKETYWNEVDSRTLLSTNGFSFGNLDTSKRYKVEVTKPGYHAPDKNYELWPEVPGPYTFNLARTTKAVSGEVRDLPSDKTATVRLVGADAQTRGQQFDKAANGSFAFNDVPTGTYDVKVDDLAGYSFNAPSQVTVGVNGNTPAFLDIGATRDTGKLIVYVPQGLALSVRVEGPDGIDATFEDVNESFVWPERPTGVYKVTVTDPQGYSVRLAQGSSNPVEVKKDQTASVKFEADRVKRSVSGRVTNLPAGKTATVRLVSADAQTRGTEYKAEGVNGSFTIPNVPTGTYDVKVDNLDGYSFTAPSQVTVGADGNTPASLNVNAVRDVYSFGGSVVNAPAGVDLKVRLSAAGEATREVSVRDGKFAFQNVPTAKYSIQLVGAPQGYSVSGPSSVDVAKTGVDPQQVNYTLSEDAGSITGKVVDQAGKRVEGAKATLKTRDGKVVRDLPINTAGEIKVSDVAPGQYTVVVELPEQFDGPVTEDIEVRPGGTVALQPVPVVRSTNSFGGSVANAPAGVDMKVRLSAAGEATREVSVRDGKFAFQNVPTAKYSIQLVGAPQGYSVSGPSSVDVAKDGIDPAELKFSLSEDAGSITGKVVDQNGDPVKGAKATLKTRDGKVVRDLPINAAGEIKVTDVAPGQYTVVVELPEQFDGPVTEDIEVRPGGTVALQPVPVVRSTNSFGGSVANAPAGVDMKVRLSAAGEATREVSVRDGKFAFQNVPTAKYSIQLVGAPQGYSVSGPSRVTVSKRGSDPQTPTFELTANPAKVTGTVTDGENKPLPGTVVEFKQGDEVVRELVSDEQGKVRDEAFPSGEYTVVVVPPSGYDEVDPFEVTVKPGEDFKIPSVAVSRSLGAVSGVVNKVPAGAKLRVRLSAADVASREVDVVGEKFSFADVPTGAYKIELLDVPQGYAVAGPSRVTVSKQGSDPQTPTFELTANPAKVTGTVTDGENKPLPGTVIEFKQGDKVVRELAADERGVVRDEAFPSGEYTVVVVPPSGYEELDPFEVRVKPGDTFDLGSLEITPAPAQPDPKGGTLILPTVKDGNGNEIPGADVYVVDTKGNTYKPEVREGSLHFSLPEDDTYTVISDVPEEFLTPKPQVTQIGGQETKELDPIQTTRRKIEHEPLQNNILQTINGRVIDELGHSIKGASVQIKGTFRDPKTGEIAKDKNGEPIEIYPALSSRGTKVGDGYFITEPVDFSKHHDTEFVFSYRVRLPKGWENGDWPEGYIVEDQPGEYYTAWTEHDVALTENDPVTVPDIVVPVPLGEAKGSVVDQNGNPVEGLTVYAQDSRGDYKVVKTDENGEFVFDDLPPGETKVKVVTPEGVRSIEEFTVAVRPGEATDLPTIRITRETRESTGESTKLALEKKLWGYNADTEEDAVQMVANDSKGMLYTFVVTNEGDVPLTNIAIDDPVLASEDVELQMPKGWTAESVLEPKKSVVFSATAKGVDGQFASNTAVAHGVTADKPQAQVASDPDSAYAILISMTTEKKVNARFATNPDKPVNLPAHQGFEFTYEVTNTGATPMIGVTVTDTIYEGDAAKFDHDNPGKKGKPLAVQAPEGFNGTLLPGERVVFKATVGSEHVTPGLRHHNAAEAVGKLPPRPKRGKSVTGEPDYGDGPSSELRIRPRENLKGNAHIIVDDIDSGSAKTDLKAVAWVDRNGNGVQDEGEGVEGLTLMLRSLDKTPTVDVATGVDGNALWQQATSGDYYIELPKDSQYRFAEYDRKRGSLTTENFTASGKEKVVDLRLVEAPQEGSSLGKCLSTASSASNPVAWLVPIGLLTLTLGGIGVMFEDELNAAAAQVNQTISNVMPGVNINIQTPEWVNQIQAQIDQVNRQLAEINPAAPAAVAGAAILALAGLVTALYWLSCEAGWNEPKPDAGSSQE